MFEQKNKMPLFGGKNQSEGQSKGRLEAETSQIIIKIFTEEQ